MASISSLKKNPFWQKKFNRALQVRDTNQNGVISQSDFDMIVDRYKEMKAPKAHLDRLKASYQKCFSAWGLADKTTELTFEQCSEVYSKFLESQEKKALHTQIFGEMFDNVDMDGNGVISYDEWVTHYKAMGIDTKYARASFDAMDENGDGQVVRGEFVNYHKEFFFTAEDKLKSSILYGPLD